MTRPRLSGTLDAAEAGVAGGVVRRVEVAGPGQVSPAILVGTQERPAAADLRRHARVPAGVSRLRSPRVVSRARPVVPGPVPVVTPLPNVARHVHEPEAVRRKRPDRAGAGIAVRGRVLARELALKRVRPPLAVGALFRGAPAVFLA